MVGKTVVVVAVVVFTVIAVVFTVVVVVAVVIGALVVETIGSRSSICTNTYASIPSPRRRPRRRRDRNPKKLQKDFSTLVTSPSLNWSTG